jgi:hypothetical protein
MGNRIFRYIVYAIILILFISLVAANPTRDEYNGWVAEQVMEGTQNVIIQGLVNLISEPILNTSTTHTDYIIFSIYETDLSLLGVENIKVIGIWNHFIPLSGPGEADHSDI